MSRRERRQAARAAHAAADQHARSRAASRSRLPGGFGPLAWTTIGVAVIGVVVVVGLLVSQGAAPRSVDVSSLREPITSPPSELASGRSLGADTAPVTLEIWSDFQCPACGQLATMVEPALIRDYVTSGVLRIELRDAAFQGARAGTAYDESVEAAAGARCAAAQGAFWPFHDWLFANQVGENAGAFRDERLRGIATTVGLDVAAWDACRATGQEQAATRAETQQAVAAGITATPTLLINGQPYVGLRSAEELGGLIEAAATAAGS